MRHRRRARFGFNPRRRHRIRYRSNRRRHYRRNPDGLALTKPMTWVPYLVTGGLSAVVTGFAPRLLGPAVTPMMAYGVQGAVAIAGGLGLPMVGLRPAHGLVWFLVGGAVILADVVSRYLMPALGLAAYPYESHAALSSVGQEPYYPPRLYGADAYSYEYEGEATPRGAMGAYEPVPGFTAPFDSPYGAASHREYL